ncbi:unnamed protein product [Brachionus calyciflorus]|uniref:BZIP domain-containing protein n=1 Tax=Brachionus calyciflorus TaxID=104777 RepID=A0A814ENG2_9BILA|nr:unnamed protein product [Brachionus calyciflorus]
MKFSKENESNENADKINGLLEQKRKACIISKKYRERKRIQNEEFENKINELEKANRDLTKKIEDLNAIRIMYGFEILKYVFLNNSNNENENFNPFKISN